MDTRSTSPPTSSSRDTPLEASSRPSGQSVSRLHGGKLNSECGNRTGAEQPDQSDRQWSVAEETKLAELVSKYWPMIVDEARRDGSPIPPADSPAWLKISTELGTVKATVDGDADSAAVGSDIPMHTPESCNKHWTTVANQMQAVQDAQVKRRRSSRSRQNCRRSSVCCVKPRSTRNGSWP